MPTLVTQQCSTRSRPREWIRYSTPEADGAEYIAVCMPAFAMETVHRDD